MPTVSEGASTVSSAVSLVKTIIGAGLLSMPLAFSTDGLLLGVFIVLLAAATSGYGLFLQAYVSRYVPPGAATFFNICRVSYPSLSVVFDLAIAVQCFGCAISYLILIGDLMPTIITHLPFVEEKNYVTFWTLASAVTCVPLSFLKNLDSLKYTSILGLAAIGYLTVLVLANYFFGDYVPERGHIGLGPPKISGIFSTLSIIVFAYTGHQNMFSVINEARDRSLISLTKLVNLSIVVSSILFIAVGITGYLTFGDRVGGNVILLFHQGWTTTLGRLAIVFMVNFSFPLMIHPARISVNNIYYWIRLNVFKAAPAAEETPLLDVEAPKDDFVVPFSTSSFNAITIGLLVVGYYLAITVKSFALVLAIVGATGSTAISFILPGLFGYKLIGSESDDPTQLEKILKYLSLLLVIWGFAVMVTCLYVSLFLNPAN